MMQSFLPVHSLKVAIVPSHIAIVETTISIIDSAYSPEGHLCYIPGYLVLELL